MQMSFSVDIDNYISTQEIEEMIQDEIKYQITDKVIETLRILSITDIIRMTANKIVLQLIEEQDVDFRQKLADKTLECIDDLSLYHILRNNDNGEKSKGQIVLDECIKEAKPKIKQKINSLIEDKLDVDFLVEAVTDEFYNKLQNLLIKKEA